MLIFSAAIVGGLVVLIWSADRFIAGAAGLARLLGASPMLIGLTVVAFGTSAPEMVVSALAALNGTPNLAIGNAIGSNICNMTLVLGATAILAPLAVQSSLVRREFPILMVVSLIAAAIAFDLQLDQVDGGILLLMFLGFVIWLWRQGKKDPGDLKEAADAGDLSVGWSIAWTLVGLILLPTSSQILVWGATGIATEMGVSELVIGLTIVAIGTSLPELAASLTGALKGHADLALGNVIGSNLFNLLLVYAMPALIAPGPVENAVLHRDFPIMLVLTGLTWLACVGIRGQGRINRFEGGLLLAAFVSYQLLIYNTSVGVL